MATRDACKRLTTWKLTGSIVTAKVKVDASHLTADLPLGDTTAVERDEATLVKDAGAGGSHLPPVDAHDYNLAMVAFFSAGIALAERNSTLAGQDLQAGNSHLAKFTASTAKQCPS